MPRDFWSTLSDFCTELAPVSGPLLSVLGETAAAIDRANNPPRKLQSAAIPAPQRLSATKPRRSRSGAKRRRTVTTEADYA